MLSANAVRKPQPHSYFT